MARQLLGVVLRILTRKVGQTGLGFGMRPEFISRYVCARLQVSVYSTYDLFHPS